MIEDDLGAGRRGTRLGHAVLDVFRGLGAAGEKDSPGRRVHRLEFGVALQEKAILRRRESQQAFDQSLILRRYQPQREHDHLLLVCLQLARHGVLHRQAQVARSRIFQNLPRQTPDILDTSLFAAPVQIFEALAESTDVYIVDGDVAIGVVVEQ